MRKKFKYLTFQVECSTFFLFCQAPKVPHRKGYRRQERFLKILVNKRKEEKVTCESIEELITAWRARYHKANRKEKTKILDEFVALTGLPPQGSDSCSWEEAQVNWPAWPTPDSNTNKVKVALLELWELSGKLRSESLAPFLSEFMDVLERNGELTLRPEVKKLLG